MLLPNGHVTRVPPNIVFRENKAGLLLFCFCLPCNIDRNNVSRNMFRACFVFSACSIYFVETCFDSQPMNYAIHIMWLLSRHLKYEDGEENWCLGPHQLKQTLAPSLRSHLRWEMGRSINLRYYVIIIIYIRAIPFCRMWGPATIGMGISSQLLWLTMRVNFTASTFCRR